MQILDIVVLLVLIGSILLGMWRGFVKEVCSLATWIVSFVLAGYFADTVAKYVPINIAQTSQTQLSYAVGFVICFVVIFFVCYILANLLKSIIDGVNLTSADIALGSLFGLLRGLLVLVILAFVIQKFYFHKSQWWQQAYSAVYLTKLVQFADTKLLPSVMQNISLQDDGAVKQTTTPDSEQVEKNPLNLIEDKFNQIVQERVKQKIQQSLSETAHPN